MPELPCAHARRPALFRQIGPCYVWGTGIDPNSTEETFAKDNYYYSFTRLAASGTITIAGQAYEVEGTTWMDHEYGYFGGSSSDARVRWLLQDMQLDNGYTISNAGIIGEGFKPEIGVPVDAYATVQDPDGNLYYVASVITSVGPLQPARRSARVTRSLRPLAQGAF